MIPLLIASCDEKKSKLPKSTFDAPFPKRNKDLTAILGKQLTLKTFYDDTLQLRIAASKNANLITNAETGDTLFYGRVSKFRGLYYFNEQLNDSSYLIYAVKITDNLMYGFDGGRRYQGLAIDDAIEAGRHKKLVKFIDTSRAVIRLHPDKKELKSLFTTIIDYGLVDTIIHLKSNHPAMLSIEAATAKLDADDYELFSKVYPNPVSSVLHVELQEKNSTQYTLTNLQGKTALEGKLVEGSDQIDVRKLPNGTYVLTLIDPSSQQKEALKIIKSE